MKVAIINQLRAYFEDCTVSDVYLPNTPGRYCYALEDIGRPANVKVFGKTCIPEGVYKVVITYSPKYKKDMIQLYNVEDMKLVELNGVKFSGVRVHGGNTVDDSLGCPLVAKHFNNDNKIWQSTSKELTEKVKRLIAKNDAVYWVISHKTF